MKKMAKGLGLAILVLAFAFPAVSFAQGAQGNGQVQVGAQGGKHWHGKAKFPAIVRSLGMLKKARNVLQHGRPVFGGHRAQAIQAVDQAIAQCKAALEYARAHKAHGK